MTKKELFANKINNKQITESFVIFDMLTRVVNFSK